MLALNMCRSPDRVIIYVMSTCMKPGIKILSETIGSGAEVFTTSCITATHSCYLNEGDVLYENRTETFVVGDREKIAGLRYGLEGMRVGGQRKYQASPHLCYGEEGVPGTIPPNALLIFDVTVDASAEEAT